MNDGSRANPGHRLLSLFPAAAADPDRCPWILPLSLTLRCGPPSSSSAVSRCGDLGDGRVPGGTRYAGLLGCGRLDGGCNPASPEQRGHMRNENEVTTLLGRATACLQASATHPGSAPRGLPGSGVVRTALRTGRPVESTTPCPARPAGGDCARSRCIDGQGTALLGRATACGCGPGARVAKRVPPETLLTERGSDREGLPNNDFEWYARSGLVRRWGAPVGKVVDAGVSGSRFGAGRRSGGPRPTEGASGRGRCSIDAA